MKKKFGNGKEIALLWGTRPITLLEDIYYSEGLNCIPSGTTLFPQESDHYDAVAVWENGGRETCVMSIRLINNQAMTMGMIADDKDVTIRVRRG